MQYVVKPCGTFGVKSERFLLWANAFDHAIDLIESGRYSRVMIGTISDFLCETTYEALGYITREDGVLRWVAYAGPPTPVNAAEIIGSQVRGYRNLMPCS